MYTVMVRTRTALKINQRDIAPEIKKGRNYSSLIHTVSTFYILLKNIHQDKITPNVYQEKQSFLCTPYCLTKCILLFEVSSGFSEGLSSYGMYKTNLQI